MTHQHHHHHHHHHHLHELPRCSCALLELIRVSHAFYVIPRVPANSPQINPKCGHRGRPKTRAAQNQCCKMQIAENHSGTMCDRSRRPPMELDSSEFRFPYFINFAPPERNTDLRAPSSQIQIGSSAFLRCVVEPFRHDV